MKQWYEVFYEAHPDEGGGTQTVAICKTLKEALGEKKGRENTYYLPHHIDKWEDADNPRIVRDIELGEALNRGKQ